MDRRTFCITLIAASIAGRASAQSCERGPWCEGSVGSQREPMSAGGVDEPTQAALQPDANLGQYGAIYGRIDGERFPVPAVKLSDIDPVFLRHVVSYSARAEPGRIVVDPHRHFLYLLQEDGTAVRYGVGVGRAGFAWSGAATVHDKQEWPDWYPPRAMLRRQPQLWHQVSDLQGGLGVRGGPRNPLGAHAMYLWQGNKDTPLSNPRHQRAMDDRQEGLFGLHSHDQPGRRRSLSAHLDWRRGCGAGIALRASCSDYRQQG